MTTAPSLLNRLNTEWANLASTEAPASWAQAEPVLPSTTLGDVLAMIRLAPDDLLSALLRIGAGRDVVAQRVVLQAMLPRIVLDAAADHVGGFDEYVSELWVSIADYPLTRRPARIAANLALDTRKRVRRRTRHVPVDPGDLLTVPAPEAEPGGLDAVLTAARRAALIDAGTERTLRLVYSDGLRSDQAAALLGTTPAALRQSCSRAVRRLAAHAAQLADAVS